MKLSDYSKRIFAIVAVFVAVILLFGVVLFDTQVIHGEEYAAKSVQSIASSETVKASRGNVTDRNGNLLITNRLCYSLTFDTAKVTDSKYINEAIFRLLSLLEEKGLSWNDTLPITMNAPFSYTLEEVSNQHVSRLNKFIQARKWSSKLLSSEDRIPDFSATTMMAKMCSYFKVSDQYTDEEARKIIGVRYELAIRKIINTTAYVLVDDISAELIGILEDGNYEGVVIKTSSTREYNTTYAAHVLGRVGQIQDYTDDLKEAGYQMDDVIGLSGIEEAFESYLRGTNGTRVVTTDMNGKETGEMYTEEPVPGNTVSLTLDIDLQEAAERALDNRISQMVAQDGVERGGAVVVIEVGTGDVLAMASYPTFDLATYTTTASESLAPFYNRATQGLYAPGSTFKPCTSVAALESGTITTSTQVFDGGVYTYYDDYQPKCWALAYGYAHGYQNVSQAITNSCNVFFYEVGRLTGISTLAKYATLFGLGQPTGIEIKENIGQMTTKDYVNSLENTYWTDGLTLQAAIGQGYDYFSILQLANYTATLANGGNRYAAHLLKNVTSTVDGSTVYASSEEAPVASFQISSTTLNAIKEGMSNLVSEGSIAYAFADCPVPVAAKTGTAQVNSPYTNGVFICFAPVENPEIAVACVIEKGGVGSALATIGADVVKAYFSGSSSNTITSEYELLP